MAAHAEIIGGTHDTHTHMPNEAPPKRPHPGLSNFPCPPPMHIPTHIAHLGQFATVIAYLLP